jgi:hypothetical protein
MGVGHLVVGGHRALRRHRGRLRARFQGGRAATGEQHHVGDALLEAGSVVGQHKDGTGGAVTDQPDRIPNKDRARQPVAASGDENRAAQPGGCDPVDGGLDGGAVVRLAVALGAEVLDIDRLGIVGPGGEDGRNLRQPVRERPWPAG